MNNLLLAVILCLSILTGCASANKLTKLNIGMTKQEVVSVMGPPTDTESQSGYEFFRYWLYDNVNVGHHYFLRFIDGKLESFTRGESPRADLVIVR